MYYQTNIMFGCEGAVCSFVLLIEYIVKRSVSVVFSLITSNQTFLLFFNINVWVFSVETGRIMGSEWLIHVPGTGPRPPTVRIPIKSKKVQIEPCICVIFPAENVILLVRLDGWTKNYARQPFTSTFPIPATWNAMSTIQ